MGNTSLLGSFGGQAGDALMFRNRIINGDMTIDQRNAGASITIPNTGVSGNVWGVDRFIQYSTQASKYSVQQNAGSVTPPDGFANYLGHTSLSTYSVTSGDYFFTAQKIEGFNTADLMWGTASAKSVTLSFWVRSSLTGTFGGSILNSAINYSYPFSYSIPVANTWTQISVTISGPTTGTWIKATNGIGMWVVFSLGAGSTVSGTAGSWSANSYFSATGATSVVGTNGATLYITGVQLEAGPTATPFERRPIGVETQLAMRYYFKISPDASNYLFFGWAKGYSANNLNVVINNPVPLRAKATTLDLTALSTYAWETGSTLGNTPTTITIDGQVSNFNSTSLGVAKTGAFTAGAMYWFIANNTTASIGIGAEL